MNPTRDVTTYEDTWVMPQSLNNMQLVLLVPHLLRLTGILNHLGPTGQQILASAEGRPCGVFGEPCGRHEVPSPEA